MIRRDVRWTIVGGSTGDVVLYARPGRQSGEMQVRVSANGSVVPVSELRKVLDEIDPPSGEMTVTFDRPPEGA